MKRLINILFLALMPLLSLAQDVEMADTMRSNGKIYVVVGVIAIIFVGFLFEQMIFGFDVPWCGSGASTLGFEGLSELSQHCTVYT